MPHNLQLIIAIGIPAFLGLLGGSRAYSDGYDDGFEHGYQQGRQEALDYRTIERMDPNQLHFLKEVVIQAIYSDN